MTSRSDIDLTRAAASSIASGMPSRRVQIDASVGAVSSVTAKVATCSRARSRNRRADSYCSSSPAVTARVESGIDSGGTR